MRSKNIMFNKLYLPTYLIKIYIAIFIINLNGADDSFDVKKF